MNALAVFFWICGAINGVIAGDQLVRSNAEWILFAVISLVAYAIGFAIHTRLLKPDEDQHD